MDDSSIDLLSALTEINLDDLVASFGWQDRAILSGWLRRFFAGPARKFALQILDFDRAVGEKGLARGAQHTLYHYVHDVKIFGHETLPKDGPVLYLSNHPGMADTLSLFAAIGRNDLRIIALGRPFLQSIPNVSNQLLFISDDAAQRMGAVKKVAAHLRNGGAVLTFPAGHIEPDPDIYTGAKESLDTWLDSAGVFVRFAPETKIVPVLVRGTIWEKTAGHPLTWIKRERDERERLAAALQLLSHVVFGTHPVTVRIQFARPIGLDELGSTDTAAIHAAVLGRMRGLLDHPPAEKGHSVL